MKFATGRTKMMEMIRAMEKSYESLLSYRKEENDGKFGRSDKGIGKTGKVGR